MANQKNYLRRILCSVLVFALLVSNFAGMDLKVEAAVYSANGTNVLYDGNGEISKTLANGKNATVTVNDSVIKIVVNGQRYGYYNQICVATCVISEDDLLHIFWHTGDYYVYDLYESGLFIRAYKSTSTQCYCSEETSDAYIVKGSSAANVSFHSCIIDSKYFYQYSKTGKKLLMTREEFQNIVNPQTPTVEPTQVPTVEPTVAPTQVPTVAPTEVPTVEPTVAPTQVPTVEPTVAPTQLPTVEPTVAPTQVPVVPTATPVAEIDSKTEFNFEYWLNLCIEGTITWEQLSQILWENHWRTDTKETETSVTYYFYDENNRLIKEVTVTTSNKTETGTGTGTATEETKGEAKVDIKAEGNGEVTGEATTETKIYVNVPTPPAVESSTKVAKKTTTKTTYHVKKTCNKVKLTRTVNGKTGVICSVQFKKGTGIARFDGITYRNIKYVCYTATSHQIVMIRRNGTVIIVPRAKGAYGKTYKAKTLKGKCWKYAIENACGLTVRVSDGVSKVRGVKNATPKRI